MSHDAKLTPRTAELAAWMTNDAKYKAPEQLAEVQAGYINRALTLAETLERERDALGVAARELYASLQPIGLFGQGGNPDQWSLIWRRWKAVDDALLAVPESAPPCDHTVGMDSLWSHMISASALAERGAKALDLQEPFKFCPDCGARLEVPTS